MKFNMITLLSLLASNVVMAADQSPPTAATGLHQYAKAEGLLLYGDGTGDAASILTELKQARDTFVSLIASAEPLEVVVVKNNYALLMLPPLDSGHARLPLTADMLNLGGDKLAQIVRHEACHKWAIAAWQAAGLLQQRNQPLVYGHAKVADWLDETLAVACEPEGSRMQHAFTPIPMAEYFTMAHPAMDQLRQQLLATTEAARQGPNNTTQQVAVIKNATVSNRMLDFYTQSAWIREFILHTLGQDGLKILFQAAAAGQDPGEVIKTAMQAGSRQTLDEHFHAYLQYKGALFRPATEAETAHASATGAAGAG